MVTLKKSGWQKNFECLRVWQVHFAGIAFQRIFADGSIWKPPIMTSYTYGMPDELIKDDESKDTSKGSLSNS